MTPKKTILITKRQGKPLEISIGIVDDWECFDKLITHMQNTFNVTIVKSIDGPGARRWILEKDGIKFELIHDDGYGNYLLAPTKESEKIVLEIGADIESRLLSL